ncbi:uncharacterized protein BO96DRAFT_412814 [Aspergillus niger CBS 101883]|uniref:uncharacterized protein n=1 Tax=Aspergillus lacticoffeatus (strain CBS 101883) TaxID=1450533 RepID=UPI000D7FC912|nr:uncharacterized protein BO96DRAFT_412814 [Aspergillus niger CBS 101883]PYH56184.1 hypothetical protein BO96DRAFT_412814 [Aspergillus niger CBS 101883]
MSTTQGDCSPVCLHMSCHQASYAETTRKRATQEVYAQTVTVSRQYHSSTALLEQPRRR